jgi:hypothetical protein
MFTDDEVKTMKEEADEGWLPSVNQIKALLARLEAAEEVIKDLRLVDVPMGCVERWRKSAGKAGA